MLERKLQPVATHQLMVAIKLGRNKAAASRSPSTTESDNDAKHARQLVDSSIAASSSSRRCAPAQAAASAESFPPQPPQTVNAAKIKPLKWDHFITHSPKHPHCPVCQRCKVKKSACRKLDVDHSAPPPVEFGDIVTLDWGIIQDWGKARSGEKDIMVYLDRGTQWIFPHAAEVRDNDEIIIGFTGFLGKELNSP